MSATETKEKDKFTCTCGNDTFTINTRGMVRDGGEFIDTIECELCGDKYKESPAPSKIKELGDGDV